MEWISLKNPSNKDTAYLISCTI